MEESGFKKVCEHFMELFNPAKQPQISGLFLIESGTGMPVTSRGLPIVANMTLDTGELGEWTRQHLHGLASRVRIKKTKVLYIENPFTPEPVLDSFDYLEGQIRYTMNVYDETESMTDEQYDSLCKMILDSYKRYTKDCVLLDLESED